MRVVKKREHVGEKIRKQKGPASVDGLPRLGKSKKIRKREKRETKDAEGTLGKGERSKW